MAGAFIMSDSGDGADIGELRLLVRSLVQANRLNEQGIKDEKGETLEMKKEIKQQKEDAKKLGDELMILMEIVKEVTLAQNILIVSLAADPLTSPAAMASIAISAGAMAVTGAMAISYSSKLSGSGV